MKKEITEAIDFIKKADKKDAYLFLKSLLKEHYITGQIEMLKK